MTAAQARPHGSRPFSPADAGKPSRPGRERRDIPGDLLQTRSLNWQGGAAEVVDRKLPRAGEMHLCVQRVTVKFTPGARARWAEHRFGGDVIFRGESHLPSVSVWPSDGELHSRYELDAQQQRSYLVVFLEQDFLERAVGIEDSRTISLRPTVDHSQDTFAWQLARVIKAECDGPATNGALYVESAATMLAHTLVRCYGSVVTRPAHSPRGGLAPYQLKRVREYVAARIAEDITLSELASVVGLTTSHFCRAFKLSTGLSPHRWHVQQRVDMAKSLLLSSDSSLAEIAGACGFFDQAHFSTAFRKSAGASPGAWRRENRS